MKFSIRRINEWLIVFLLLIFVPVAFFFLRGDAPNILNNVFNLRPSTIIVGYGTVDAIAIFSGNEPSGYPISWITAAMYFNVVLYLMLGPYLLFKGYKKARANENRAKPWYWFIGVAICIGAVLIVPVEINTMHRIENDEAIENNEMTIEKNRTLDVMRTELAEVGFAAAQHEILEDGVNESFKIEDLNMDDLKYEHTVESIQSDTLLVISVSNQEQPDLGHRMEIRPYSETVLSIRN